MKITKFVTGKISLLTLFVGILVASFFLGKSITSASPTIDPDWVDVGSCVAACGSSEGQQKQEKTTVTRVCDQGCPEYTFTTGDYSKTFTYEKSSDPNHCHKPTPVTLEIPEWARGAYGSTVPELADFIDVNCRDVTNTETKYVPCVATVIECPCSDVDGDEVCDSRDNCLSVANPDQVDSDENGVGDACESNPVCGNQTVETGEQCDDGDINDGDGCSATCTLEESTDFCENLEGEQTTLPDGMQVDNYNFCSCKEGYDEVNSEGQIVALDGLANFTCVAKEPTPTDLCTNIDGIQSSVPGGMHINATGHECVNYELGGAPAPQGGSSQVLGTSTTSSISSGQVLGANTMGGAGSFAETLYLVIMGLGGITTTFGIKKALRKN